MVFVITTQDHTPVHANEDTQEGSVNSKLTNVHQIHANMGADVKTMLGRFIVCVIAAIPEQHVKAM